MAPPGLDIRAPPRQAGHQLPNFLKIRDTRPQSVRIDKITPDLFRGWVESKDQKKKLDATPAKRVKHAPARMRKTSQALGGAFHAHTKLFKIGRRKDKNCSAVQQALQQRVGASSEALDGLFVEWDRNGDGAIDKNELQ
jgi:hypothetical protein